MAEESYPEESWLLDRKKLDELQESVRRLMAGFQTKKRGERNG